MSPAGAPVTLRTKMEGGLLTVPLALSYQQVVLERRVGAGWRPVAVAYPRTLNREEMRKVAFDLPPGLTTAEVRVQGYRTPKFPARFVYGKTAFSRAQPVMDVEVSQMLDRLQLEAEEAEPVPDRRAGAGLWQMTGGQLFFFNPFRGLQVLDMGDPTHPLRTGSLRLPVTGTLMSVLDEAGGRVLLLGRSSGKERPGGTVLLLLTVTEGVPAQVAEVPVSGRVTDHRLIGETLYLLSVRKDGAQGRKAVVTRVDLGGEAGLRLRDKVSFSGGSPVFRVAGARLLVEVKEGNETRQHEVAVEGAATADLTRRLPSRQEHHWLGYEVAVSGQTLRVRSLEDAQEPILQQSLAWRTDRVLPVGEYLVQVEDGRGMAAELPATVRRAGVPTAEGAARLRITPANDPDLPVQELELGPGKVIGLSQKGTHLFIVQWVPESGSQRCLLRTWAVDLAEAGTVKTQVTVDQMLQGLDAWDVDLDRLQPLWVDAETLVWLLPARHHPRLWWSSPFAVRPARSAAPDLIPASTTVMVVCPLRFQAGALQAGEPRVLRTQGRVMSTSRAFAGAGFIFFSHDILEGPVQPAVVKAAPVRVPLRPQAPQVRSWLQVVDFRAVDPVLRDPVSLPGKLLSVTQADAQGAVLLTHSDLSLRRDAAPVRVVQACAYDGVRAYQLDAYVTATSFHSAAVADGTRLYLTREMGRAGVVAIGYESGTGRLSQVSSWNTNAAPALLHVSAGHLLASSHGYLELAGIGTETGKLTPIASYDTPVDLWLQVDRATITPTLDLWIPAGEYGVEFLQKQAPGR